MDIWQIFEAGVDVSEQTCAIIDYRRIMWSWTGPSWTSSFGEPRVLFIFMNLHGIFRVKIVENIYFAQYVNIWPETPGF